MSPAGTGTGRGHHSSTLQQLTEAWAWNRNVGTSVRKLAVEAPALAEGLLVFMRARSGEVHAIHANTLIGALKRAGHWQHACRLLFRMPQLELQQDHVSFNSALGACAGAKQWERVLEILMLMPAAALLPDRISFNVAVGACGKASVWPMSLDFFAQLLSNALQPNEISYGAVISACEKGGQWELALSLLFSMPLQQLTADVVAFNSAISACEKTSLWQQSLAMLALMPQQQLAPSFVSFSAAVSACGRSANWEAACSLLDVMRDVSQAPNVITYNAAISACERAGRWQMAMMLLHEAFEAVSPDVVSFSAAISACGTCSEWQLGLELLRQMELCSIVADRIAIDAAMSACARGGAWELGLMLLSSMTGRELCPDDVSFNAALSCCERAGRWVEALALFTSISERKPSPDAVSAGLVCSAAAAAPWRVAVALLGCLLERGLLPNGIMVGSLLQPIRESLGHGEAVKVLFGMRDRWLETATDAQDVTVEGGCSHEDWLGAWPGICAVAKPSGVSSEDALASLASQVSLPLGTVSRLDLPTSGVLPAALGGEDAPAAHWLRAQFSARLVKKEYWCLCAGRANETGAVTSPLRVVRSGSGSVYTELSSLGRAACTEYRVLSYFRAPTLFSTEAPFSLLEARPLTGRTHQIRAHLASVGLPILGDDVYGQPELYTFCPRLFLHCRRLELLALNGQELSLEAPLPADLHDVLDSLETLR